MFLEASILERAVHDEAFADRAERRRQDDGENVQQPIAPPAAAIDRLSPTAWDGSDWAWSWPIGAAASGAPVIAPSAPSASDSDRFGVEAFSEDAGETAADEFNIGDRPVHGGGSSQGARWRQGIVNQIRLI